MEPLTPERRKAELDRLKGEVERRNSETAAARRQRISDYTKQRNENGALLLEIEKADFELSGEDTVSGYPVWVVSVVPPRDR